MAEETHSQCPSADERATKGPIIYFRYECTLPVRGFQSKICACPGGPACGGWGALREPWRASPEVCGRARGEYEPAAGRSGSACSADCTPCRGGPADGEFGPAARKCF